MAPRRSAALVLAASLALLSPAGAAAQHLGVRAGVGLGAEGTGEARHLYYGGELGGVYRGVGLVASAAAGSGNGFSSRLLAATPTVRAWERGRADIFVTAGAGRYREVLDSGPTRSTTVVAGGVSGRIPVGPVRLAVVVLGFRGSLGPGEEGGASVGVGGLRLLVGVGL